MLGWGCPDPWGFPGPSLLVSGCSANPLPPSTGLGLGAALHTGTSM